MNRTRNTELTPEISTITRHKVNVAHTHTIRSHLRRITNQKFTQTGLWFPQISNRFYSNIYPERQHYSIINLPDAHTTTWHSAASSNYGKMADPVMHTHTESIASRERGSLKGATNIFETIQKQCLVLQTGHILPC